MNTAKNLYTEIINNCALYNRTPHSKLFPSQKQNIKNLIKTQIEEVYLNKANFQIFEKRLANDLKTAGDTYVKFVICLNFKKASAIRKQGEAIQIAQKFVQVFKNEKLQVKSDLER